MVGRQKPKRLRSMGPIWSEDNHFDSNHVICIYMAMVVLQLYHMTLLYVCISIYIYMNDKYIYIYMYMYIHVLLCTRYHHNTFYERLYSLYHYILQYLLYYMILHGTKTIL